MSKKKPGNVKQSYSRFFTVACVLAAAGFLISALYYFEAISVDRISCYFWITSMVFLYLSIKGKTKLMAPPRETLLLVGGITLVYFVTHFWNYNTAPWNNFGLFDDAAWDIYFSKIYCFSERSFQIIFSDFNIGRISRELFFHYYITVFFKLFGYNLFVFNISLVVLGYVTVLFTGLIALRLFKSHAMGALAALILNFYPLHYTQVFMGHRYAICAPLMVVSLYFLIKAYQDDSPSDAVVGGVFAAFCVESAIMGKHYVYGLVAVAFVYALLNFKKLVQLRPAFLIKDKQKLVLAAISVVAFLFALSPLITYLLKNYNYYMIRENVLTEEFFRRLRAEGLAPLRENLGYLSDVLFKDKTYNRQFSADYPAMPYPYLVFVVPGMVVAFLRKHYIVPIMIGIPLVGNLVTIAYDFRILISSPFFILTIVYSINSVYSFAKARTNDAKKQQPTAPVTDSPPTRSELTGYFAYLVTVICGIIMFIGFWPTVKYTYDISTKPNHIYLLDHSAMAASRMIQDVAAGKRPSPNMKHDELNPRNPADQSYDVMAATRFAYALAHLYMQNYDSYKVLSMLNNFPYRGSSKEYVKERFRNEVAGYEYKGMGLRIAVERGPEVDLLIDWLIESGMGSYETLTATIDEYDVSVFIFTVERDNVEKFKEASAMWNG